MMEEMSCTACGGREFEPKTGIGFVCEYCGANYLVKEESLKVETPIIGSGSYSSPYKIIGGWGYKGRK